MSDFILSTIEQPLHVGAVTPHAQHEQDHRKQAHHPLTPVGNAHKDHVQKHQRHAAKADIAGDGNHSKAHHDGDDAPQGRYEEYHRSRAGDALAALEAVENRPVVAQHGKQSAQHYAIVYHAKGRAGQDEMAGEAGERGLEKVANKSDQSAFETKDAQHIACASVFASLAADINALQAGNGDAGGKAAQQIGDPGNQERKKNFAHGFLQYIRICG